eukprot:6204005-Pleurochrysis_carterae.AAC.1
MAARSYAHCHRRYFFLLAAVTDNVVDITYFRTCYASVPSRLQTVDHLALFRAWRLRKATRDSRAKRADLLWVVLIVMVNDLKGSVHDCLLSPVRLNCELLVPFVGSILEHRAKTLKELTPGFPLRAGGL